MSTKFIAAFALAALTLGASIASTTQAQAQPFHHHHHRGWGVGAGLLGAAIVGGAIAANDPYPYYYRPYRCGWVPQYDVYGNYVGRVRSCY